MIAGYMKNLYINAPNARWYIVKIAKFIHVEPRPPKKKKLK